MEAVGNTVLKAFIALTSKSSIINAGERFNPVVTTLLFENIQRICWYI